MSELPEWYLSHFINKSYEVIGFQLQPYSAHHYIHLTWMNSKMLKEFDPKLDVLMADIETACLICSTKFGENVLQRIDEYNADPTTKTYREQLYNWDKEHPEYFGLEYDKFKKYLSSYELPPTNSTFSNEPEEQQAPCPIPWPLLCVATAMKTYGYSESDAMNMPISKLVSLAYTNRYLETGECPILSELDIMCLKMARGLIKPEDVFGNGDLTLIK